MGVIVATRDEQLASEIVRLRRIDRERRRISEEAEATARELRNKTQDIARRLEKLETSLRRDEDDATRKRLWDQLDELVKTLTRL